MLVVGGQWAWGPSQDGLTTAGKLLASVGGKAREVLQTPLENPLMGLFLAQVSPEDSCGLSWRAGMSPWHCAFC